MEIAKRHVRADHGLEALELRIAEIEVLLAPTSALALICDLINAVNDVRRARLS